MSKGMNPNDLFNQARKMKDEMARVQAGLRERIVEGTSGGGLVRAQASCDQSLVGLRIEPSAVDTQDLSLLEDLVVAAVNQALKKASEIAQGEMSKVTGGLSLPGL